MPLIPDESVLGNNSVLAVDNDAERFDIGEAITSSLQSGSPVLGAFSGRTSAVDSSEVDPDFNPFSPENLKGYETEADNNAFDDVFNAKAMDVAKAKIDFERRRDRLAEAYPIVSFMSEMAGGLVSPTTLLPGGALVRSGKIGYSTLKTGATVAASNAVASGIDETVLQGQQVTRSNEETALAIGGSVFLGAIVGSAGAKFFTKAEWDKASKSIDVALQGDDEAVQAASRIINEIQSLSADAVADLTLEDLSIGGPATARAWAAISAKLKLAPVADILQSPSLQTRKTFVQLAENSIRTVMETEGRTINPSVETAIKQFTRGEYGQWMTAFNGAYREARAGGFTGSKVDFDRMIGMAMRRSDRDPGGNPQVEKMAQLARQRMTDPLLKRAQASGLLPDDVKVETAESYFTRVHNSRQIISRENEYRSLIRPWFEREFQLNRTEPKGDQELIDFVSEADYEGYIDDAITATIDNLTGRGDGDTPEWLVPLKRGPLKERVFAIPDEIIEDFLISDASMVLDRYTRTMAAEVELTAKFGRADMRDQFQDIRQEYDELRKSAKSEKQLRKYRKQEDNDLQYLQAWRDKIRGTYRQAENSQWVEKAARSLGTFNVVTKLGDVVAGSLGDGGRPIAINGMTRVFGQTIPSLAARTRLIKIGKADLRYMGPSSDVSTSHRMAALTDMNDPHAAGSPYERFLANVSNKFMKFTLLPYWNDFMQSVQGIGSQSRLADNIMSGNPLGRWERQFMAELNVDEMYWPRIADQIKRYGEKDIFGSWGVHIDRWDDDVARRIWASAINKDAARGTLTLGVADTPLWMDQPGWRLAMQFKGFLIAANQKILIAGLQGRLLYLAQGLVMATAMGMFGSYVKALTRGDTDGADRLLDNPGLWIASGLDRSGFFPLIFEPSNILEKIGNPYGVTPAIQALFQDEDRGGTSSRYATRNAFGAVFGPSVGVVEDLARVFSQLAQGDLKPSGVNAFLKSVPGNTLPGARTAIHAGIKPWLQDAVD